MGDGRGREHRRLAGARRRRSASVKAPQGAWLRRPSTPQGVRGVFAAVGSLPLAKAASALLPHAMAFRAQGLFKAWAEVDAYEPHATHTVATWPLAA